MRPFLAGLTGHVGSGKSTLLAHLTSSGVFVINGDAVAKRIIYTEKNKGVLVDIFGGSILDNHGEYDLKEIRRIFFPNQHIRELMQNYFSNRVWKEIEKIAEESGELVVVVENAVLFEQGWKNHFNLIVCLYCDEEEAIRRVVDSGKLSYEEVTNILDSQMPIKTKIELADISIDTTDFEEDEGKELVETLMRMVEQKYLS